MSSIDSICMKDNLMRWRLNARAQPAGVCAIFSSSSAAAAAASLYLQVLLRFDGGQRELTKEKQKQNSTAPSETKTKRSSRIGIIWLAFKKSDWLCLYTQEEEEEEGGCENRRSSKLNEETKELSILEFFSWCCCCCLLAEARWEILMKNALAPVCALRRHFPS